MIILLYTNILAKTNKKENNGEVTKIMIDT